MVTQTLEKGYKQTELGIIPEDWDIKKFTECADLKHGFQFREEHFSKDGIIIVKIGNLIDGGGINLTNASFIPLNSLVKFSDYALKKGDVLMALTGATLGKVSIVDTNKTTLQNYRVGKFVNKKNINKVYVYYLLQSSYIQKKIRSLVNEAAQPNIGKADFDKFLVPISKNKEEQAAIAEVLSETDALIRALDRLLEKKKNIKQGAMQTLLTGKNRLLGFSGEWEVKQLNDLADIYDGTHQTPKYVNDGFPFYSVENVTKDNFSETKYISSEEHKMLTKFHKIEKGDILMTRIGSIGKCKYINWNVNASFYVSLALLKIKKAFSAEFIYQYSNSFSFKKEAEMNSLQLAAPKKINLGEISKIKVFIPCSKKEQSEIAKILFNLDAEIEALEQKREKFKQIKVGLMQQLLTGGIRLKWNS